MTVSYYDVSQQYQLSIQRARRQQFPQKSVFNTTSQSFQVPVICTAAQALTGCTRALYRAAHAQISHQFTLPPQFLFLQPGDVVRINRRTGKIYYAQITYCEIQPDLSIMTRATNISYNSFGNIAGFGGQVTAVTISQGIVVGGLVNENVIEPLTIA